MQQYQVHQVATLSTATAQRIYQRHGVTAEAPSYTERRLRGGEIVEKMKRVAPGYVMVPTDAGIVPSEVNAEAGKPIVFRSIGTLDAATMDRMRATPDDDKVPVKKVVRKGDRVTFDILGAPCSGQVMRTTGTKAIVRLAGQALTKCRQRVQQATLQHRGWKGDPLYGIRKLLLMGAEHLDEQGWDRLHRALRDGDLDGHVRDAWVAKEYVRDIYLTDDPIEAEAALERVISWCRDPDAGPELRTLAKTLHRWQNEILAHHTTGASNGKVEAANLTIKQVKRSGRGFRNLHHYRLRILLAGGCPRQTHHVTRHRARPRFIA